MLGESEIQLETDYLEIRDHIDRMAETIIYTGAIDSYFNYCYGELGYRSLRFETEIIETDNYQGVAVVNYTDVDVPYTRIIEHKHFEYGDQPVTVITREYPEEWNHNADPYYPINDDKNNALYRKYRQLADKEKGVVFGGRLGSYQYFDMQDTVKAALKLAKSIM